jgi:hypothetical protein
MAGCIFCGGTPLTLEHLWPDWLRRELGPVGRSAHHLEQDENGVETRDVTFETPPFNQQVRAVCATCNGGWMSELEAAAKPILLPLIEGRGGNLDRREQQVVATWALLKACVFDELHPQERAVPAAHRDSLYAEIAPAGGGLWVSLGTYVGRDIGHYAYQGMKLARADEDDPEEPTLYFVTITLGALVVQVVGSLLAELTFSPAIYAEDFALVQVWPTSPAVQFDQRVVMDHETLVGFTKMLYKVAARLTGGAPEAR